MFAFIDGWLMFDAGNRCLGLGNSTPPYMTSVLPGGLLQLIPPPALPPAQAPLPVLEDSDVTEPPLPSGAVKPPSPTPGASTPTAPAPTGNGQPKLSIPGVISGVPVLLASLFLLL